MTLKWLHKKLSNLYSVAPMVVLMLFSSYRSTPSTNAATNYTAKDMFTSIFFGSGELANSLPVLQNFNIRNFTTDPRVINQASQDQERIYNAVNAMHPEYLPSLKNAVASGNHLIIQNNIQLGARYINEAYSSFNPNVSVETREALARDFANQVDVRNASPDELKNAINDYVKSGGSNEVMGVLLCVAIVLLIFIALLLVIPLIAEGGGQVEASLAKEMIVNAIATSGAK